MSLYANYHAKKKQIHLFPHLFPTKTIIPYHKSSEFDPIPIAIDPYTGILTRSSDAFFILRTQFKITRYQKGFVIRRDNNEMPTKINNYTFKWMASKVVWDYYLHHQDLAREDPKAILRLLDVDPVREHLRATMGQDVLDQRRNQLKTFAYLL